MKRPIKRKIKGNGEVDVRPLSERVDLRSVRKKVNPDAKQRDWLNELS